MKKYSIRFNKSRGTPGRGSLDHVWRVFEDEAQEYIFKHVELQVPSYSEKAGASEDWNIVCHGVLNINKETSTATITPWLE